MGKLFGTDGIRGVANEYPLTPEMAVKIGRAVAAHFKPQDGEARILVGKDTRVSGDMLENALISGICAQGVDVLVGGIIPTPAVAHLTASMKAAAGIMISASHNPYADNGIKVFNRDGFKLDDHVESDIESQILNPDASSPTVTDTGRVFRIADGVERYARFLIDSVEDQMPSTDLRIVLDCANGATYQAAPMLFNQIGTDVEVLFAAPDGRNINEDCGSQHTETLQQAVLDRKADIGLAFDGDGDRLIAVDETGNVVTGDQILCICAKQLKDNGRLKKPVAVSTVMSNMGLGVALEKLGIQHVTAQVGDRYVLEEMRHTGAVIGGEDSGHMIFLGHHTTGDGMLTALKLIEAMGAAGKPLSELKQIMPVYPQLLVNVEVGQKPEIETVPALKAAIEAVETQMDGNGRVLVRYSGTQPLCRIMVEGPGEEIVQRHCQELAAVVKAELGKK